MVDVVDGTVIVGSSRLVITASHLSVVELLNDILQLSETEIVLQFIGRCLMRELRKVAREKMREKRCVACLV